MKTFITIAVVILILGSGFWGGFYVARASAQSVAAATEAATLRISEERVAAARVSEDDNEYEEALWLHFGALQWNRRGATSPFPDRVRAVDAALVYARLSALAAKRGSREQSEWLLSKAASFCPQIGWPECSPAIVMEFSERVSAQQAVPGDVPAAASRQQGRP